MRPVQHRRPPQREPRRQHRDHRGDRPAREHPAGRRAADGEPQAFEKQLRDQPSAAGAERDPDRQLAPPRQRAAGDEAGDARRAQGHEHRDQRRQRLHDAGDVSRQGRLQRFQVPRPVAVGVWKPLLEIAADRGELFLRDRRRHARSQPRDRAERMVVARLPRRGLRAPHRHVVEPRDDRQDADHVVRQAVDPQRLRQRIRIHEQAAAGLVGDEHDRGVQVRLSRREQAAREWRDTERVEQPRRGRRGAHAIRCSAIAGEVDVRHGVGAAGIERGDGAPVVEVARRRVAREAVLVLNLVEPHQASGVRVRQRSKNQGIRNREDRGRRADALILRSLLTLTPLT